TYRVAAGTEADVDDVHRGKIRSEASVLQRRGRRAAGAAAEQMTDRRDHMPDLAVRRVDAQIGDLLVQRLSCRRELLEHGLRVVRIEKGSVAGEPGPVQLLRDRRS